MFSMISLSRFSSKSSSCKSDSMITSCNSVLWLLERMIQTSLLVLVVLSLSSFRPFSTFTCPSQDRYVEFNYPQKLSGSSCAVEPKGFSSHDPSRFIQVNGLELSGLLENNLVRLVNGLKHLIAIWNNLPGEQQHQQDGGEASPNRDDQQQQGSGEEGGSAHNGDDKSGEDRDDHQQQGSGEEGGSAHNGDDKSGEDRDDQQQQGSGGGDNAHNGDDKGAEDDEDLQGEGSIDAGEEEVVVQQEVPPEDVQQVQLVKPVQPGNGWCNTTWNKEDDRELQRRAREMKHFRKKGLQK